MAFTRRAIMSGFDTFGEDFEAIKRVCWIHGPTLHNAGTLFSPITYRPPT
jgi:hypothetical protein